MMHQNAPKFCTLVADKPAPFPIPKAFASQTLVLDGDITRPVWEWQ